MLSFNNTTEQSLRDLYYENFQFPTDETWVFYDEDKNGNSSYQKVLVTYKQIDINGFLLDTYTVYQFQNNNISFGSGDKESAISIVLSSIELNFTNQEFIDSLEV